MRRRDFLTKAAIATSVAGALSRANAAQSSPNSEIRVALIGCGSRGPGLAKELAAVPGAKLVLACDIDPSHSAKTAAAHGNIPTEKDYRKVLDRKDVDAVLIATPNHTHVLIAAAACLAGKDVYVEKPVSHSLREGRILADVIARTGRIVQVGLQNVSDKGIDLARDYYKSGALGKITAAHAFWYNVRKPIGKVSKPTPVPAEIDYDLFCGPRPLVPLARKELHYDWHWTWDQGSGEFGNTCVHNIDHTRYLLGITQHATFVQSVGGRLGWEADDGETPNTMLAVLRYPELDAPFTCEIRDLPYSPEHADVKSRFRKKSVGTFILGENGLIFFDRGGGYAMDKKGEIVAKFPGDAGATHMKNFIDAVRSRNPSTLRSPIERGHTSSAACHMANISYRLGETGLDLKAVESAAPAELLAATEAWASFKEHLVINAIDFAKTPLTLGPKLDFDGKSEKFVESSELGRMANMLTENAYRAPFVLPS